MIMIYVWDYIHLRSKGGLSVAVPGELRGMQYAHELYGKLSWKKLFQPAIKLCREGYKITESLEIALNKWTDDVKNETCLRYTHSILDNLNQHTGWTALFWKALKSSGNWFTFTLSTFLFLKMLIFRKEIIFFFI